MEHLVALFAEIGGPKSRSDEIYPAHEQGQSTPDRGDEGESQRSRDASRSIRSTPRDASQNGRETNTESRHSRESRKSRGSRDAPEHQEPGDSRDTQDADAIPPPYQEVADANAPPPIISDDHHPSGIQPTKRCVKHAISTPLDWVIHPSAPHFVICGRCYVDRIYATEQWPREFVKYRPSIGLSLRCHLGAIPHMTKRWSKVHSAEEFLSFLKVMQRKKVAKPCPGHIRPSASITWFSISSVPGVRICDECHQRLFGGTVYSKSFSLCDNPPTLSICHGSFNYTTRMVDALLESNDYDWEDLVEAMQLRIQVSDCCQIESSHTDNAELWYKYRHGAGSTRGLYICEGCFLDYVHKTGTEGNFVFEYFRSTKPRCMASLRENQIPGTPDIEHSRAEILRLLHGKDMRCYPRGTVGVKWYTTRDNPRGYGVCESCYISKIKPLGGGGLYVLKRDAGRRTSFVCWMNSYHPNFRRHQQLLPDALITGDMSRLESSIKRFSRLPGCQQGGMGQGKNKRWWGWECLRICASCVKGGNLIETPAGKRFELHGEKDPYHRFCGLYSQQVRDHLYYSDVGTLLEFAKSRLEMMA